MKSKDFLINIAKDTLNILEHSKKYNVNGKTIDISQQIQKSIDQTVLYPPDFSFDSQIIRPKQKRQGHISITNETTIAAAIRLVNNLKITQEELVILNFASGRTPGGAYKKGARTQEESLARQTSLVASIEQERVRIMYKYNETIPGPLYSDYMIYTPGAIIIRDDNFSYLPEPILTSIITSPAANLMFMREEDRMEDINKAMIQRIRKIIQVAIINNNKSIVLGAFGCGYFQNEPKDVANYFRSILIDEKYIDFFDEVVFAIYGGGYNLEEFQNIFKDIIAP